MEHTYTVSNGLLSEKVFQFTKDNVYFYTAY